MSKRRWIALSVFVAIFAGLFIWNLSNDSDPGEKLRRAAWEGNVPEIKAILAKYPAALNSRRPFADLETLQSSWYQSPVFRWIRALGGMFRSQFNILDNAGFTALDFAVRVDRLEVVSVILDHKPDISLVNQYNLGPLHQAIQLGRKETVKAFIARKVDLEVSDYSGNTPLCWAALCRHLEIATLLLNAGASIEGNKKTQMTPLHWAVEAGSKPMIELLLKHGAKVDVMDQWKRTPLSLARQKANQEIIDLLETAQDGATEKP